MEWWENQLGPRESIVVCEAATAIAAEAPSRVKLTPWGYVESSAGNFTVDDEAGRSILAAFREQGRDVVVDYEHASLGGKYSAPDGSAPASGWIKRLEAEPGVGIFAHVEWTERARTAIGRREYRYLSPVVVRLDGRAVRIPCVGLTNTPAIHGTEALVNSARPAAGGADRAEAQRVLIHKSGLDYDRNPGVHCLASRTAYIEDDLRRAGFARLTPDERPNACRANVIKLDARRRAIAELCSEWEKNPQLQQLVACKDVYVNGDLSVMGLAGLTESEKKWL